DVGAPILDRLQSPVRGALSEADDEEDRERQEEEDAERQPGRKGQQRARPSRSPIDAALHAPLPSGRRRTACFGFQQRKAKPPTPNREPSSNGFSFCS